MNVHNYISKYGSDDFFVLSDSHEGFEPTNELPGTKGKIWVMEERVRRGHPIHHPGDRLTFDGKVGGKRSIDSRPMSFPRILENQIAVVNENRTELHDI